MATIEKLKEAIVGIANRRRNVSASEIDWVVNQLKEHGFDVRDSRKTRHGVLYGVGSLRFSICCHHPGSKQVKACYIDDFIDAMTELGLYED